MFLSSEASLTSSRLVRLASSLRQIGLPLVDFRLPLRTVFRTSNGNQERICSIEDSTFSQWRYASW